MQHHSRHIVMVGPFGLTPKATMRQRALPLAEALVARGWRATLLLPPWDDPVRSGQTWVEHGVTIRHIALPKRLETWGIVHRLRAAIRAAQPDLLHLFKPKGHGALAVLGLERRYPLIVDTDDWEGRGGWNDCGGYTAAQRALFDWQERTLPRLARGVTAASRTLEGQVWGFGVPRERVIYLPNGLSARQHGDWRATRRRAPEVRQRLGLGETPTILLYTRFVEFPPERPVALLRAVRGRIPDAHLLLVGNGLRGEERATLAAARDAGLAGAVTHLPWVEWADLPATLAAGDVAILPYTDTLINRAKCAVKTLDLMAAARPIVADTVGQNTAYLEQQMSGVLVPQGDEAAFAAAVADLLADRERRDRLGAAAEERAWREFTWDALAERAEAAYARAAQLQASRQGRRDWMRA